MSKHLTPLDVCERLIAPLKDLGGPARCHPKSPYHWRKASSWRAAGDISPLNARNLLAYSRSHGLGLTADHLICGASPAEIDAILAARAVSVAA